MIATKGDIESSVRRWATDRVAQAFHRFASRIEHVVVRFADINGPRGGLDKHVSVAVTSRDGRVTRVGGHAASYEAALVTVARRARQAVLRSPRLGARRPRSLRRVVRR